MKKSFIVLMTIAGFTSLQASSAKESNLTKALHKAALNQVDVLDGVDCELNFSRSPQNRTQSTFQAIKNGNLVDAGELAADLVADGKISIELASRAIVQSPIADQIAFAKAYNLRARMNSPYYANLQNALNNDEYDSAEKAGLQVMLSDYLNGAKVTSLRIPSPINR